MALFDGIFEKKTCSICNGDIGLSGKRKLDDGVLCKECAGKLSPYFSERRQSTVGQIREQLEYREANQESVAAFNPTRTLGGTMKVLLDEDAQKFLVTSASRWREANPDVMDFSQVTGCDTEIREMRTEIRKESSNGSGSYNPPRYDINYDMYLTIHVNTPYFNEITFKVNDFLIERQGSVEFDEAERQTNEIRNALAQMRNDVRESAAVAQAPKTARVCPVCGATTISDTSGRCEYCGGAMEV